MQKHSDLIRNSRCLPRVFIEDETVLQTTTIVADSGYHSEENLKMLAENDINAIIADNQFRKRDPLFADAYKHRKPTDRDKAKYYHKRFHAADFTLNNETNTLTCPAGKVLTCITKAFRNMSGLIGPQYRAKAADCMGCIYKEKCLQGARTCLRTVALFNRRDPLHPKSHLQRMIEKFDTDGAVPVQQENGYCGTGVCEHQEHVRVYKIPSPINGQGRHTMEAHEHCS